MTAWLGSHNHQTLLAYWLGTVAGIVGYVVGLIAFEPAPFARRVAACVGIVVALAISAWLLDQLGGSLLRTT